MELIQYKGEMTLLNKEINTEVLRAVVKHPVFPSFHHGYAVIKEEVDEFWDEVKKQEWDKEHMRHELIQIAAMCQRFIIELL